MPFVQQCPFFGKGVNLMPLKLVSQIWGIEGIMSPRNVNSKENCITMTILTCKKKNIDANLGPSKELLIMRVNATVR